MGFRKRRYTSLRSLLADLLFPARNRRRLREVERQGLLSPAFRERLMLAVTAVNGCRYCSFFHAREALKTGVAPDEVRRLLAGTADDSPEDDVVALLYAQHWAESDARPAPEAVERLRQAYGTEKADAIHLVLRMIRFGNLSGNTWDYFLYRLSFGRLGA